MKNIDSINLDEIEKIKEGQRLITDKFKEKGELYNGSRLEIRESITGACNFRCRYCTEGTSRKYDRSYMFWLKLNGVLNALGIKGIHHTGGEPTVRDNLDAYVECLNILGYTSQVITTNGSNPEMLNKCIDKGVTRLNISLDTLDKKKFSGIARQEEYVYDNVMDTIDIASKRLSLFKINMVVMNKNFNEIEDMLYFAQEKGAVLRLIELYPYGPAIESGKLNYDENHVSKNEIVEKLWNIGDLSETEVDGINAVPRYYKISGFERPIAIISPNWTKGGAICGKERCIRLRAGANGNITYCNNIPEVSGDLLAKMTTEEMAECMADLIYKKNERVRLSQFPKVHPFAYKTLRFGEVSD